MSIQDKIRAYIEEGKTHTVPKTKKEKDLAAIAPPHDKITHKDVLKGRGVVEGREEDEKNAPFDGPYRRVSADVTDKSGAKHTGMSRARHIARQAMEKAAKKQKAMKEEAEGLDEKTLTPAELKKREEIAKAMEKQNPDMPMGKKMAIATAQAKKVAEEAEQIDEAKATYCGRCKTTHVPPSMGGKCPALKEDAEQIDEGPRSDLRRKLTSIGYGIDKATGKQRKKGWPFSKGDAAEKLARVTRKTKMTDDEVQQHLSIAKKTRKEEFELDEAFVIHKGKHAPGAKSSLGGQTLHGVSVKDVYTDKKEAQAHADKINAGRGYKPEDSKDPLYGGVLYQVSPAKQMKEEVEQQVNEVLDTISKRNTYLDAALTDAEKQASKTRTFRDAPSTASDKAARKLAARNAGVKRVTKKIMTREEVEQIDEEGHDVYKDHIAMGYSRRQARRAAYDYDAYHERNYKPASEKKPENKDDDRMKKEEAEQMDEALGTAAKYADKTGLLGDKYKSSDRLMSMKNMSKIRDKRLADKNAEHEKQDPRMASMGYAKHMVDVQKAINKAEKRGVDSSRVKKRSYEYTNGLVQGNLPEEVEQVQEVIGTTTGYSDSGPKVDAATRKAHQMRNVVTKGPRTGKITKAVQDRMKEKIKARMAKEEVEQVDEASYDSLGLRSLHSANPQSQPNYAYKTQKGKAAAAKKNVPDLKAAIKSSLGKHPKPNLPEEVEQMEEAMNAVSSKELQNKWKQKLADHKAGKIKLSPSHLKTAQHIAGLKPHELDEAGDWESTATPTAIKIHHTSPQGKKGSTMVFSARDAKAHEKELKQAGHKVTHRQLMYGEKAGKMHPVNEERYTYSQFIEMIESNRTDK